MTPEETRERILKAAREVISRKGKRGATTREIADVAAVNEATLFRHFGSKEQLVIAVAQRFCGLVELQEVLSSPAGTIEEDLAGLARIMLKSMSASRDMIVWSLVENDDEATLLANATWRPQAVLMETVREYMAKRVESGELRGDPAKLALTFMGFLFTHVMARKKFPLDLLHGGDDGAIQYYIDVFLNGVRSK